MTVLISLAARSKARFVLIDRLAREALLAELACYPKPGLVSFHDTGSHGDMDADTFLASIGALAGYFHDMAEAGAAGATFAALNALGRSAESAMFKATRGVNTHRGAVFSLGLLAAAAGCCRGAPAERGLEACTIVARRWGRDILAAGRASREASHGASVRSHYGAPGAREEAAAGFPTLLHYVLPAYRTALSGGVGRAMAGLQGFFASLAILEDNNLLFRAGPEGLAFAQEKAAAFLNDGGVLAPGAIMRAVEIHRAFVSRRLSPGGSADLLSACLFLAAWGEAE